MRALGARETMAGMGVLFSDKPVVPLWGRVAGDAMDLALLGAAMKSPDNEKGRLAGATGMVVGVTLLDFAGRPHAPDELGGETRSPRVRRRSAGSP